VKSGLPLHQGVLAVALVLSITLPSGASPYAGLRLIVGFAIAALVLGAIAQLLFGDRHRAGIAASVAVLLVFKGTDPRIGVILLVILSLLVVERVMGARRTIAAPWPVIGRVANLGAIVLLLAVVIRSGGDGTLAATFAAVRDEGPVALRGVAPHGAGATSGPDVFLIVLDGHARADKLETIFNHDGTAFVDALTARGFDVASASRSNYLLTSQSLPSLLNMARVADLVEREAAAASPTAYTLEIRELATQARVFAEFRANGYEVVAIASGFEEVSFRGADRFIDTGQVNELELRTLGNTLIAPAIQTVAPDWFADQHRARVAAVFEATVEVARERHDRPRFVIAHVPSPHAPVVFAADGAAVPMPDLPNFYDDTFTRRGDRDAASAAYAAQVEHVDALALEVVGGIVASAAVPPVILLLSDHGSAAGLDWEDVAGSDLDERTANLFAAFTPGYSEVFPDDVTLVNVFGRLFSAYFSRPLALQPDTAYRWEGSLVNEVPIALPVGGLATP
jgi:hypothetical protein